MSEREFPKPLGDLAKIWATAGAAGIVFIVADKSSVSNKTITAYGIDEFRTLLQRLNEVLEECDSMKHLTRHPEWDAKGEK